MTLFIYLQEHDCNLKEGFSGNSLELGGGELVGAGRHPWFLLAPHPTDTFWTPMAYLIPFLSSLSSSRLLPSEPNTMTNTATEAIATLSGNKNADFCCQTFKIN